MTHRVVGLDFAHLHMGGNLQEAQEHPDAEIVGLCDEGPDTATLDPWSTAEHFGLNEEQVYSDYRVCLEETDPDIAILCPAPSDHAEWVERVCEFEDVHIILEKPFAVSVEDADRMIEAASDRRLAINWPMAWYEPHRTAKRLIDEGRLGDVTEIHYYDGNKGSGRFRDVEYTADGAQEYAGRDSDSETDITDSWWHQPDRGGGSLYDYLGYGVTLGTWFRDGELPTEVTTDTYVPDWSPVDTHSITIATYETGLSKYETRWGTFTDPWANQPQPKCGFVVVGTEGTIASYDYEGTVRVQTADIPEGYELDVDDLEAPLQNPMQYMIHCLEEDHPVEFGPLNPELCRDAQRILDTACLSAERGETVDLVE